MNAQLTPEQIDYLSTQRLGRLATVRRDGSPQNNPVGFHYNADLGTIDIAGWNMGASWKFRNLSENNRVAFVVDDIASVEPWQVRFLEIRGTAEALSDVRPYIDGLSREMIRIHPERIIAWGLEAAAAHSG